MGIRDSNQSTETKNAGSCPPAEHNTGNLVVVEVTQLNLNPRLKEYLNKSKEELEELARRHRALAPHPTKPWRVRDRLSQREIATIVTAFKAGTAKHALAKRYRINLRSLKKLLREEGVKRKSRWDKAA